MDATHTYDVIALQQPLGNQPVIDIVLFPNGQSETTKGTVVNDTEASRMVIAAFNAHGVDLPIDYEHATVVKGERGESAPAIGWVKALRHDARGLVATVAWSPEAQAQIKSGKYRYLSPVAVVRKADRRVMAIHSVALTNKPSMVGGVEAIAASSTLADFVQRIALADTPNSETDTMSTMDTIIDLVKQALASQDVKVDPAKVEDALKPVLEKLLAGDAGNDGATETTEAMRASIRRELRAEYDSELRFRSAMDGFIAEGKVNPDNERMIAHCRTLAEQNFDAFLEQMRAAPISLPPQNRLGAGQPMGLRGSRSQAIGAARLEFRAHPEIGKVTSERAFVNLKLRESGFDLVKDEAELVG